MSLDRQLDDELNQLIGFHGPSAHTARLSDPGGLAVELDFTAVDSMSCSFAELRISVPSLTNAAFDAVKKWAEALCRRVTYLLENIGPLELDPDAGEVMIRSNPPDRQPDGTQYYEILLKTHANGQFSLRRYRAEKGRPGRTPVDVQLTHQVLRKLLTDLVDTIPQSP